VGKQDWELAFNASQTMIRRRWYCNLKKIQFTNPLKHCGSKLTSLITLNSVLPFDYTCLPL
jgi:hypothetical protein